MLFVVWLERHLGCKMSFFNNYRIICFLYWNVKTVWEWAGAWHSPTHCMEGKPLPEPNQFMPHGWCQYSHYSYFLMSGDTADQQGKLSQAKNCSWRRLPVSEVYYWGTMHCFLVWPTRHAGCINMHVLKAWRHIKNQSESIDAYLVVQNFILIWFEMTAFFGEHLPATRRIRRRWVVICYQFLIQKLKYIIYLNISKIFDVLQY